MKKLTLILLMIFCITPIYANMYYTTYIEGDPIVYMPEEGQIVKKGEILVKFDSEDLELRIQALENSLKECEECLKDSKTDISRAKTLHERSVISTCAYEDIVCLYDQCKLKVDAYKLDLEYYKAGKKDYTIKAPYNCKIIKRIVSIGSGLKFGEKVMEVEKL